MMSVTAFVAVLTMQLVFAYNDERILLTDVQAITLHKNRKTAGRRSSPVPQLNCVGGSAQKYAYEIDTVQCYNRGHDGFDVQWECKANMDKAYKFGRVEVSCEGYDHPNDPYILKGSCGLEYTLENTGYQKSSYQDNRSYHKEGESSTMSWVIFFIIIGSVVYIIQHMVHSNDNGTTPSNDNNQRRDPPYPNTRTRGNSNNPPPYGFKPEYSTTDHDTAPPPSYESTYGSTHTRSRPTTTSNGSSYGGFWSGLGLGSLAGYMFGNRNRSSYYGSRGTWGHQGNSWGSNGGWGNSGSWGGSSSGSWGSSSRGSSSSGSSHTSSGFGGTRRR